MIVTLAFLAGAALGWVRAGKRGGDRLDRLQYATAHAIFFALAAFILLVIAQRAGVL